MVGFPDLQPLMDDLLDARRQGRVSLDARRNEHGPSGTGRRVRIGGFEEWSIGDDGLIAASLGHSTKPSTNASSSRV